MFYKVELQSMPRVQSASARKVEAQRLKKFREKHGLTVRDLAREFNCAASAISQWENDERTVPGPVLKLLAIYEAGKVKLGDKL